MMPAVEVWRDLARVARVKPWAFGSLTFAGFLGRFCPSLARVRWGSNMLYC